MDSLNNYYTFHEFGRRPVPMQN